MNSQVQSEAADWVVEFQTGEADGPARERFAGWLRSSPEHVRAYLELVTLWEDAALYDRRRAIDVDALIAAARSEASVVSLPAARTSDPAPEPAAHAISRKPAWVVTHHRAAIAAAAALVMVIIGLLVMSRPAEYATGIGERRTVTLADGTSVELDAVSRIRVQFSAHERRVTLLDGQAFFRVAKSAARPFVVARGAARVRDIGTEFDVNGVSSRTVVTVVEGRVSVSYPYRPPAPASQAPVSMSPVEVDAGQQIVLMPDIVPRAEPANLTTATAWTRNELVFDSTPLPRVAMEFNRLNARQLVIEGPKLQSFDVSGVFPALDPTSLPRLLMFLRAQPGVQVTETGGRIIVTEK